MPKPTFFRLPEAKQKRLMDAANKEFARAPFNDASISHIIKDAGIPVVIINILMTKPIYIFIYWNKCGIAQLLLCNR